MNDFLVMYSGQWVNNRCHFSLINFSRPQTEPEFGSLYSLIISFLNRHFRIQISKMNLDSGMKTQPRKTTTTDQRDAFFQSFPLLLEQRCRLNLDVLKQFDLLHRMWTIKYHGKETFLENRSTSTVLISLVNVNPLPLIN